MHGSKIRVLHLITGLCQGGAETLLYHLILSSQSDDIEHVVVSMMDEGIYGAKLQAIGVPVHSLAMRRRRIHPGHLLHLFKLIRKTAPDIIQTWMYHANLLGTVIGKLAGCKYISWGIHHSSLNNHATAKLTKLIASICAIISHIAPSSIISCSAYAAQIHKGLGYSEKRFKIIPNGYDLQMFYPNDNARLKVRKKLGITDQQWLLGFVARWDPHKDHSNLLKAIAIVSLQHPTLRCILVGRAMDHQNIQLLELMKKFSVTKHIILAGPRDDIPDIMNAIDLHVLSSYGEAFPNVISESMACGTPCVATDVGDVAYIIGRHGWIVRPRDSTQLADGILSALKNLHIVDRKQLGMQCRTRIEEHFSLDRMILSYESLWRRIVR